jgi:hypothetical protein
MHFLYENFVISSQSEEVEEEWETFYNSCANKNEGVGDSSNFDFCYNAFCSKYINNFETSLTYV